MLNGDLYEYEYECECEKQETGVLALANVKRYIGLCECESECGY